MLECIAMTTRRVTVTLPSELVRQIDRHEPNRSSFVREAVGRELHRRRREALRRSLRNPHPESERLAEAGLGAWAAGLPNEEGGLVDMKRGTPIRWVPDKGWTRGSR